MPLFRILLIIKCGVLCLVQSKPSKPKITGDLNVEVNRYIALTCSSQSTSAPDYYSKLVTLSYTWFVNKTKLDGETRKTMRLYVTRDLKYNRYSCTATAEDMESERSDSIQINPLYGPDRIIITPEPGKLTVREGETIGPFVCTANCNPTCSITWRVKDFDVFSDARSEMGTLLQQAVQRGMQLFRCKADWREITFKENIQLDVQYLDGPLLYINDEMKSNIELTEYAPLRISCHVDGNPAPTIRLSRGQGYTELEYRQGTWLNYTIDTAQCTHADTYRCSGSSIGFNITEKVININVLCNTRFDKAGRFKSTYGSKSGMDTTINVAVPIIANPPPQSSDFKWDGPVQVSARTTISTGDVSYKHVIESFIPVKDHTYFGYYTLSYKGQTVTRITINTEDKPSKSKVTGDLNVEVNRNITLTCCSQSTSAPDYYSRLVTLSYTWFVNDTKISGETRETLRLYVTRDLKYNRYSCTATEHDLESDRSDLVQINPLYTSRLTGKGKMNIQELEMENLRLENTKLQKEIRKIEVETEVLQIKKNFYDVKLQVIRNEHPEVLAQMLKDNECE